ncbi:DUF1302 domain-containing protein [Marinobacterium aestuariivivens]|uniref:DUF1302 domain-containing protein n=1 Tax=Marinobacterium aestuariivivens TaxID=1698799 RepID=A0ABW2A3E1_9GAMM
MKVKQQQLPLRRLKRPNKLLQAMTLAGLLPLTAGTAHALSFTPSDEVRIDWDTVVNYGASWRVESRDDDLLADPNADDGNRSFDKGLISNRFSFLTEADLQYNNVGAFVRASGFYDDAYFGRNDHDSPGTSNNLSVDHNSFTDETQDQHGARVRMLDHFLYGNFNFDDRFMSLRLGDQVVSWGESLFLFNGISSAQSPVDATKANVPGVEVKDIFLPVGQLFAQVDLTGNLSASAYYQYDWNKTEIDAVGSYFSTTDILDEGGESILASDGMGGFFPALTRGNDRKASDSGQWGMALRYIADSGTEYGLYTLNYHDKTPQVGFGSFTDISASLGMPAGSVIVPTTYHLDYVEDIRLHGASISTLIGDTQVSGELSYRVDAPVLDQNNLTVLDDIAQAQVSVIHVFGSKTIADMVTLIGEAGYNRVMDRNGDELANDKSAWGYTAQLNLDYYNVFTGVDMTVPINFSHGVNGKSSVAGTFSEGDNRASIGASFTYLNNLQTELRYTAFLGDADESALSDRDFVSFNVKYSF